MPAEFTRRTSRIRPLRNAINRAALTRAALTGAARSAGRELGRKTLFEQLENRQLMSVVDVTNFGAVPNDARDDTAAVVSAMRAAAPGDTISFPAGTFNINRRIDVKSGLKITGVKQDISTIKVADGMHAFRFQGDGLTINDITFIGGGLFLDSVGSRPVLNITIERVHFTEFDHGSDVGAGSGAIGAPGSRVNNMTIADCTFDNSRHGMSMYLWTGDNWLIADNAFIDTNGGVKTNNGGSTAHNIRVIRNYWSGTSRMGAEMQGQIDGFLFADNFYENPVMSTNFHDNDSTFAFSLIYHGITTRNVEITRNTVLAPQRLDGTGVRLAFEVGNDANIHDNLINGIGTASSLYMGDSSGGATSSNIGFSYFQNNRILDAKNGVGYAYGPIHYKAIYRNNGPDVTLSWDITRGRPGPGGGFDHEAAGGGGSTGGGGGWWGGDPQTTPASGYAVPLLTAYVLDATRIALSWTDLFSDEAGFRVERSMDNGVTFKKIYDSLAPNITQFTDKGLPSGTSFMYRVFMYKADGTGVHSTLALAKTRGFPPAGGGGSSSGGSSSGGGNNSGGSGASRAYHPSTSPIVTGPAGTGSDDPLNGVYTPSNDNPFINGTI